MSQNKPELSLKRDLQGVASDLKWSVVELLQIARRLESNGNLADAQGLKRMAEVFQRDEAQLNEYAEALKEGRLLCEATPPSA
ncbi:MULTISPECIES: hypothetical protein [unclassified Pseudomonas]|uniref:hypothetical protein n=1 Tax=unclassified Pseudomonas TaxID=196821 RepID=UPI000BCF2599|nr:MULTISPECIES: hypothetical protein [unclassified Pseudomonas]PVZ19836.1 hypothetical protein F474_00426 [Pseudomonas sp. URIL14HWK12:I12]PVZ26902.1 hypothetical protein F470_00081 [Pseudomonas sp. URIL14HWK12:I10]PVZ37791.1 hypothetical protein F472_00426 [Pseudomonas sp. URIL14HWK12:I11]SNZ05654.1 hypothetical protein SAMN05660463_00978 [Pseudomonas sp. URIL14HWK12:I9]